jgi:hypothetical protein
MDIPEAPQTYKSTMCEVERMSNENFNPLLFDVMDTGVVARGQIARMVLPSGFERGESKARDQNSQVSYEEFHPADAPDAMLCFFYRGHKMSAGGAEAFKDALAKPAHILSQAELQSLSEVLRDKAKSADFNILSARTEDLKGKRVMLIEGRYRSNQEDVTSMLIDASGDGRSVQEVFFQAPKQEYTKHIGGVRQALKSIEWKARENC